MRIGYDNQNGRDYTGIGTLIHIYSIGYMHDDDSRPRFFAYLSLFTFAMLMLVQAYDATGQRDKAIELAREAIGAYPASARAATGTLAVWPPLTATVGA